MSDDVECPYCEKWNEVIHDDGFGYEEGVKHQMTCVHCDKMFVFETSVSYYYDGTKANCLNDGEHNYELSNTYPKEFSRMICSYCDRTRDLTDDERIKYEIGSIDNYLKSLNEK